MTPMTETPVRMGLIRKKDSWTTEAFDTYWHEKHGPLVSKIPNLREYWQNPVIDRLQRGIDYARGPWDLDGFSQLWFDATKEADEAFNRGSLSDALITDENHFLGSLHIVTASQREVIKVPHGPARS